MPKLIIDGIEVDVESGLTILQAAEEAGIEIPRFCYHDRLSVAGNCRMCLVEIEKSPKPVASCAMPVGDGMVIKTKSKKAVKARNGVMEFLLINHPLDCPICDQGGECDLQDQAMAFGFDKSRFVDNKRAVKDKYMGPIVSTKMTRCIHCTRCVRFVEEVAGVTEIGATGRGEDMEITTFLQSSLESELSGNVVDLCPVGALTNKPYEFTARSWELNKTETVDVHDSVGSNIRVDSRGREVMRILPRLNEDINEEWIADKSRNSCDGLKYQRLDFPLVKRNGVFERSTWSEAFEIISAEIKKLSPNQIAALSGDLADCESIMVLKDFMSKIGVQNIDCRQDGSLIDRRYRSSYIFNSKISGIDDSDCLLLIGTNPRKEAPIINARIRKRYLRGDYPIGLIGDRFDLTYDYRHISNTPEGLTGLVNEDHNFYNILEKSNKPMIVVGMSVFTHPDVNKIINSLYLLCEKTSVMNKDWNGYNVLHTCASRVGGIDLGFIPGKNGKSTKEILKAAEDKDIKFIYLLGADEFDTKKLHNTFVVYQGHHGDKGANIADVILPGCAYTEKDGTYVNTEGRVQLALKAVSPPGDAKEDWKIIRALSEVVGCNLKYKTIDQVRKRMAWQNNIFANQSIIYNDIFHSKGSNQIIPPIPFNYPIKNYYQTDVISRASKTMAECTKEFSLNNKKRVER